jgi:hypothetical protein
MERHLRVQPKIGYFGSGLAAGDGLPGRARWIS